MRSDRVRLGKTVIFAEIVRGAVSKGNRVVIVTHRDELLRQASDKLNAAGVDHGIIASGYDRQDDHLAQVASVQTLVRRLDSTVPPRLLVIDEAQHAAAGTWQRIIEAWPAAARLGVTATPERLDGRGLGDAFDDLILGPSVAELQAQGYLARARYYAPPQVADLTGLGTRAGDYAREAAAERMQRPGITGDAIQHYQRLCPGARAVAFCVTVSHAETVASELRDSGIAATSVDGSLSTDERRSRLAALASGEIRVVTSCELISEGFDLPSVEACILLRPTASMSLHLQQIGRALRPAPGKAHSTILDHVGNLRRHGLAETPRTWTLAGRDRRASVPLGVVRCPTCYACYPPGPACPQCGSEAEATERRQRELQIRQGELEEIRAEQVRVDQHRERRAAQTYDELLEIGRRRGYRNPSYWARQVLAGRGR